MSTDTITSAPTRLFWVSSVGVPTGRQRLRRQRFTGKLILQVEMMQRTGWMTCRGPEYTGTKTYWRDATLNDVWDDRVDDASFWRR